MSNFLRLAGAAMIVGGILFFARMAPVMAVLPDDMGFPPDTAQDLIRLVNIAGARWPLSHALGLIAVALLIFGYWGHARALASAGHKTVGAAAAVIAAFAFGAFAVALTIDGFAFPAAAMKYVNSAGEALTLAEVQNVHERALSFFTPAMFFIFIAAGVLASRMLHGFIHSRWLGGLGMVIAIAGPTAYLFGAAGPNWDNLQIGGSLIILAIFWTVLVGAAALFGRGVRNSN